MNYQINLYSSLLRPPKLYFSLHLLLWTLFVAVLLLAGFGVFWQQDLTRSGLALRSQLDAQTRSLATAQAALLQHKPGTGSVASSISAQLLVQRAQLQAQSKLLEELERGQFKPDQGYSAQLALIARSIPANAWVSEIRADAGRLELSGFTLLPAALNTWLSVLSASPLLDGQSLAAIRVEKVKAGQPPLPPANAAPLWSFMLKSAPLVPGPGSRP